MTKNQQYNVVNACTTHPHNIYMQLLAETGLLGFLPIFSLFLFVLYKIISHGYNKILKRKINLSDYEICLYCAALITLWPFIPTGSAFNNWNSLIYFLPAGFLLQMSSKKI